MKCVSKGQLIFSFYVVIQTPEELEDDSDFEQEDYDVRSRTSVQTEDDQLIAGQSARVRGHSQLWKTAQEKIHTNGWRKFVI